jgi:hypothetical protein
MSELDFQAPELLAPPGTLKAWQGPNATTFRECVASAFNDVAISAELVGRARSPLLCDATVLPYHGRDRRIRQYSTESELSYRKRLAKWRQIWGSAGRAWGILRQLRIFLAPYGRPMIRYVSTSGDGAETQWFTLAPGDGTRDYFELGGLDPEFSRDLATPANWIWDADATDGAYSRFWILIYTSGLTGLLPVATWDGADEWDGSAIWDGYFAADMLADLAQLCSDWASPTSFLKGLFLVHDDTAFDPTGSGANYPDGDWDLLVDPTTGAPTRRTDVTYSIDRTFVQLF